MLFYKMFIKWKSKRKWIQHWGGGDIVSILRFLDDTAELAESEKGLDEFKKTDLYV